MLHTDKVIRFVRECQLFDIEVLPPDVNHSYREFTVEKGAIRYGLAAIKNVGENAMDAVVKARKQGGPFRSITDLCLRTKQGQLNRRSLENLVRAGALDGLDDNRAALLDAVPQALSAGTKRQEESQLGFMSLFAEEESLTEEAPPSRNGPEISPWSETERLAEEQAALGFYFSGHPMHQYEAELNSYGLDSIHGLREKIAEAQAGGRPAPPDPKEKWINKKKGGPSGDLTARVGAMLVSHKLHRTKNGDRMAFLTLEDQFGQMEALLFPNAFATCQSMLEKEAPLVVEGSFDSSEEDPKLLIDNMFTLDSYRGSHCRAVAMLLDGALVNTELIDDIMSSSPFSTIMKRAAGCWRSSYCRMRGCGSRWVNALPCARRRILRWRWRKCSAMSGCGFWPLFPRRDRYLVSRCSSHRISISSKGKQPIRN